MKQLLDYPQISFSIWPEFVDGASVFILWKHDYELEQKSGITKILCIHPLQIHKQTQQILW